MKYCTNCGKIKGKYDENTGEKNNNYCDDPCCDNRHIFQDYICIKCGKKQPYNSGICRTSEM